MSFVIGLTGPTGAGKSILCGTAQSFGFKVVDCDIIARKATEKGSCGLNALVDVFSESILNGDGTLDRKALARIAFKTPENTALLNKTILPFIVELVKREITTDLVLLDAPTLFEGGVNSVCNCTVAVLADVDTRLERIIARDNISREDALLRIKAGKPDEFYRQKADYIIYNNAETQVFNNEFSGILTKILKER